jgi:hypothetical protein
MRDREVHTGFWWGRPEGRGRLEDLHVHSKIILNWIKKWGGGIDWIDLAQDSDSWRALVDVVMNFLLP